MKNILLSVTSSAGTLIILTLCYVLNKYIGVSHIYGLLYWRFTISYIVFMAIGMMFKSCIKSSIIRIIADTIVISMAASVAAVWIKMVGTYSSYMFGGIEIVRGGAITQNAKVEYSVVLIIIGLAAAVQIAARIWTNSQRFHRSVPHGARG